MPEPLYSAANTRPAYKLYYAWTGWPASGTSLPEGVKEVLPDAAVGWERDGLRLLQSTASAQQILMTFSVKPHVAPVLFTARVKGRLQHALRQAGHRVRFSRKVAMRSIGENTRADVEQYIESQVRKEPLADPAFRELLEEFTVADPAVDLSLPTETLSGRYWYNLHVVLVTEHRFRIAEAARLRKLRDRSMRIAAKKGYAISRLSAMPDHVHIALRGNIEHAPQEIALAFQNNLAYAVGQVRVWQATYYVATFSEYDMGAVRRPGH